MSDIKLAVGDHVHFWAHATIHDTEGSQPQSARVASVLPTPEGAHPVVNLQVLAPDGTAFAATDVTVFAADAAAPTQGCFCKVIAAD